MLAGVAFARLRRLRANQQRHRRRGRDILRPAPGLRETEARVRAVADEDTVAWVDATNRFLWRSLRETEAAEIPAVIGLRAGTLGVELLLDRPAAPAPNGFVARDGGRVANTTNGHCNGAEKISSVIQKL